MDWKPEVRIWMALGEILEAGERCGACGWHAPYCTNKACLPYAPDPFRDFAHGDGCSERTTAFARALRGHLFGGWEKYGNAQMLRQAWE